MSTRGRELIATDESTIIAKSFLNATVVEHSEGDGCFPDPPRADEGNGFEVFCEANKLSNQLIATETGPRRGGWRFTGCTGRKCEMVDS